ncbi:hypothetical protein NDU88_000771 [Pleurodeles waltl]|uniref:Uncharacterized protein n=1 Tax=Pleurodeles waltl TaxID=8319 RepID=A0AAV7TGE3_PLEWA|nr:hypothetical protein NDU88_000771 [Pleurodeles waltl]
MWGNAVPRTELPLAANGVAEPGRPCEHNRRWTLDRTAGKTEGRLSRNLCMRPPDGTGVALGNAEGSGRGIALELRAEAMDPPCKNIRRYTVCIDIFQ